MYRIPYREHSFDHVLTKNHEISRGLTSCIHTRDLQNVAYSSFGIVGFGFWQVHEVSHRF
jgi:hypothetical protein